MIFLRSALVVLAALHSAGMSAARRRMDSRSEAESSELGVSDEKILALEEYATSPLYEEKERVAQEYADRMTLTDQDVDDELFSRLRGFFDDEALVELTAAIAWENSSSKFNRALRVPSQRLCKGPGGSGA
jgi:alkylhydroperoxidase family enzyme